MKCPNCGAELEGGSDIKFCQYCGHKVETPETEPTTLPGAIHGIAKGIINEVGKQMEYQRTHADEIKERKKEEERENFRQSMIILLVSVLLIGGIIGFCFYMGEREEAKQNAKPISYTYICQKVA